MKINLPKSFTVDRLKEMYRTGDMEYRKIRKRMRLLDAVDSTELWKAIEAKFPRYQILPDTNHVAYIKNNILASIYTVGKSASLIATSEEDKDIVANINAALDGIWSQLNVSMYQMQAGERAALLNLGVTQVGWDNSIISGGQNSNAFYKGNVKLKNINPLHYMRDPYADSLDTASYVVVWDRFHKSVIMNNPGYREQFKEYLAAKNIGGAVTLQASQATDRVSGDNTPQADCYYVFTYFVRDDNGDVHEIHLIENEYPLMVKESIKPAVFPFAELYCNLPNNKVVGVSEPAKIFANSLAYNLMESIILTSDYKNQRPPRFVNGTSGLNVATFTKYGNDADRTFIVQGDASKAVHYHQFPTPSPTCVQSMGILAGDIKNITGVDDRYTGRDTGSVLTTGGVESMLAQVTMIDTPKITLYENYCKRLTQLIISNLIEHSAMNRKYFVKDAKSKEYKTVEVPFYDLDSEMVFAYEIAISSYLPKNKAAIQAMADKLMQMQMQYGSQNMDVDLITPQEWLMMQDLPMQEYMLERMGVQRSANWTEIVAQTVSQYADMVEQGVDPNDAILATADTLKAQQNPEGRGVQEVVSALSKGGMPSGM